MSWFVLASTLIVWLATVAVMLASSLALDRGVLGGFIDGTFFSLPLLLLGVSLFLVTRKQRIEASKFRSPLSMGLLLAWLPALFVLGAVDGLSLLQIAVTGEHLGESALIYIVVFAGWFFSACSGAVGIAIGTIWRDRKGPSGQNNG